MRAGAGPRDGGSKSSSGRGRMVISARVDLACPISSRIRLAHHGSRIRGQTCRTRPGVPLKGPLLGAHHPRDTHRSPTGTFARGRKGCVGEGGCAARAVEEGKRGECKGEEEEGPNDTVVSVDVEQRLRLPGELGGRAIRDRFCNGIWRGRLCCDFQMCRKRDCNSFMSNQS